MPVARAAYLPAAAAFALSAGVPTARLTYRRLLLVQRSCAWYSSLFTPSHAGFQQENFLLATPRALQQTFGTRHKINQIVRLHDKLLNTIVNLQTTNSQSDETVEFN